MRIVVFILFLLLALGGTLVSLALLFNIETNNKSEIIEKDNSEENILLLIKSYFNKSLYPYRLSKIKRTPISMALYCGYVDNDDLRDFLFFLSLCNGIRTVSKYILEKKDRKISEIEEKTIEELFDRTFWETRKRLYGDEDSKLKVVNINYLSSRICMIGVILGMVEARYRRLGYQILPAISNEFKLDNSMSQIVKNVIGITYDVLSGVGRVELSNIYPRIAWIRTRREMFERLSVWKEHPTHEVGILAFEKALTISTYYNDKGEIRKAAVTYSGDKHYLGLLIGSLFAFKSHENIEAKSFDTWLEKNFNSVKSEEAKSLIRVSDEFYGGN